MKNLNIHPGHNMKILETINNLLEPIRCLVTKWWRPLTCLAIAGSVFVHGIILPLMTKTYPDLMGLSALITAATAAFAVREWAKIKGTA